MKSESNDCCPKRLALCDLPPGVPGKVAELNGQPGLNQRLREMGFCESAVIQRVAGNDMVICDLCGIRVALSDRAADGIVIEPLQGKTGGGPAKK